MNQLTGRIPSELAALSRLKHLQLNQNQLSGTIPVQFAALTNIHHIFLCDNAYMCGNVPVGFQPGTATWACASGGRMGTLLGSSCPQQESINSLSNAAYRFLPNASMVVD